jgi:hypothetical protein
MHEPNLPTDPAASRERFATYRQPRGNREGPTLSFCRYWKKRKPPIILASLGCFFDHLSYSLRTARLASSFLMLAMRCDYSAVPLARTFDMQFQFEHEMGTIRLRFLVEDPDALFNEFRQRGVGCNPNSVHDTSWGTREFALYDLGRNALTFYRDLTSAEKGAADGGE